MTGIRECFSNYWEEKMNFQITIGNKEKCTPIGRVTVVFQTESGERFRATNALHVPRLGMNLLSMSQLQGKGYDVFFIKEKVYVKQPSWKNKVQIGIKSNRLYRLQLESPMALIGSHGDKDLNELWRRRMGHFHHGALRILRSTVTRVPDLSMERDAVCRGCALGKYAKAAFPISKNRAKSVLGLIHSDFCGPMSTKGLSGADFAHVGEYVDKDFIDFCAKEGINREWTAPYNSKQNGVAERKNRTIVEVARAVMYDQDMPKFLRAEACNTIVYVQNKTPHQALSKITPEKVFTGKTPEVNHFTIFGSLAYCRVLEEKKKKLDQTVEKWYLVGYSENAKAYIIYLPRSRKVVVRRDVKFMEDRVFRKSREMPSEEQSKEEPLVKLLQPTEVKNSSSGQEDSEDEEKLTEAPTGRGRTSRELRQILRDAEDFIGAPRNNKRE
eukprot:PITA_12244